MIKITHIITGLAPHGAERMLYKLVSAMDSAHFENQVISLTDPGTMGAEIQALGVRVRALGMRRGLPNPLYLFRLARWLGESRPQVIQTWMYHADLMGGLAAQMVGRAPVVWGVHHNDLGLRQNKRLTIGTAHTCARLSRWLATRIVCCSQASQRMHTELGYAAEKMEVIPNGFDLQEFRPDVGARLSLRRELGVPAETLLIGMAARFHPQKDHHNFVQAAALLHAQLPEIHLLLCGDGVTWENPTLAAWVDAAGIRACCHLLGARQDMPRVFAAMDIATSSSLGESFPMAVGEAMACGIPCVVTDVGDSALIVGDTGKVVPRKNPEALAHAWRELLVSGAETRQQLGAAARRRTEQRYGLPAIVARYQNLYTQVAQESSRQLLFSGSAREPRGPTKPPKCALVS